MSNSTITFDKAFGFTVPSKLFPLLKAEFEKCDIPSSTTAITLNFRDTNYSPEAGGFHPVEIRLEKHGSSWRLSYITDFSYQGVQFPELVKEIDVCFLSLEVTSLFDGLLKHKQGQMLLNLFVSNFIEYHDMGVYEVSATIDQ